MSRDPIKFRCFQCQKLLGVSPSKAGAVVACPKCGAALLVPEPAPEIDPAAFPSLAPAANHSSPPEHASAEFPTLNFGDLRLQDSPVISAIRDSATENPPHTPAPAPAASAETADAGTGFPVLELAETSLRSAPARRAREPLEPRIDRPIFAPVSGTDTGDQAYFEAVTVEAVPVVAAAAASVSPVIPAAITPVFPANVPPENAGVTQVVPVVVPPAFADERSLRPDSGAAVQERLSSRRRDDVLLPRTAVLLWSFFVIVALAFAFGAGLLCGRFLWTSRLAGGP